jgi:hypothetical protein
VAAVTLEIRRLEPPVAVLVLHDDGLRYSGFCERWTRHDDGSWWALCRYTTAPGMQYVRSLRADRVGPLEEGGISGH